MILIKRYRAITFFMILICAVIAYQKIVTIRRNHQAFEKWTRASITLDQQAKRDIQAAYNSGQGKVAIICWPSNWDVNEHSIYYRKNGRYIMRVGQWANVTTDQDDMVIAKDPKTGTLHTIRATMTWHDSWKHIPKGWFLKKQGMGLSLYTIDGKSPLVMD